MASHDLQTSFNGGAVSQRLYGRVDTAIYDIAVAEMVNFAPTVEGPAIKRSGTMLAGEAHASSTTMVPFEYNSAQAYAIEVGDHQAWFYSNSGGPLLDGGGTQVTVAGLPWSASEAQALDWQQSADVLYLAHPAYPPAKIARTGAASFAYSALQLSGGPFKDQNSDRTVTVYASDTTVGTSVTLTASSPIFLPAHVGGMFQMQGIDFSTYVLWEPGMSTLSGALWRSDGKIYQSLTAGNTGSTPPTHTSGAEWDGTTTTTVDGKNYGVQWQYVCDQYGQLQITATGDPANPSATATATVVRRLMPDLSNSARATWRWSFGRFSPAYGWPKMVRIWNNRLVFFTDYEVFGSVVGDYLNFSKFDDTGRLQDDLAFYFRITGSNPIRWAEVDLQLLMGTDRAEYVIGPTNAAQAASATNLQCNRQSKYGGAAARALQIGTKTIFVQRGGRKLREAAFDYTQNRYVANNMMVWCRHLARPGIKRIVYQQESEETIWALRNDGALLMHAYSPEQQVKGWAQAAVAGPDGSDAVVLDLCVIPSAAGAPDMLWLLIQRGSVKTVEWLADWWSEDALIEDARFLDGAIAYSGAPATHIGVSGTGFPLAWAGEQVTALADGKVITGLAIASDGSVTLPVSASKVCAGFFYVSWISGLPAKLPSRTGGFGEMLKKRLMYVLMRVVGSAGLTAGQLGSGRLAEMFRRPAGTPMDSPAPLVSGISNQISTGGNSERSGGWRIESASPLPAIVSMIRATYEQEEKE